jgi:tryptophan synthase beta chain
MEAKMTDRTRFLLNESDIPKFWYNINADNPMPPTPVLHPQTLEPVTPDFLSVLFPMELILQEISTERYIEIPEEVRELYKLWRPTPLIRARRLEKALDTPAHIYYKYEGASPVVLEMPNRGHRPRLAPRPVRSRHSQSEATAPILVGVPLGS